MTAAAHDTDPVTVAEVAVLAAVVSSLDAARDAIAARLEPRHFRHPHHRAVYAAVHRLATADDPVVEPAAVITELGGALDGDGKPGGAAFVGSLPPGKPDTVRHYAERVRTAWQHRNLRGALAEAADLAAPERWDAAATPAQIRALIDEATAPAPAELSDPAAMLQAAVDALENGADPALSTGYPELDAVTGGVRPGEVVIVAARTNVGKTLLGLCMAEHIGTELDVPVLYSSLEMRARQLQFRRLAAAARVPLSRLVAYAAQDRDWDKIGNIYPHLTASQLRIDDTPVQTMAHIDARLTQMARAGTPAAAHFLDYAQLVLPADLRLPREQQVAAISREYGAIAKRHNAACVMIAQLNRGPEHRRTGRPQLADLRESGSLEQDADVVILLHRDTDKDGKQTDDVWAIVAKNRYGPLETVKLNFQGWFGRIGSNVRPWTPHTVID